MIKRFIINFLKVAFFLFCGLVLIGVGCVLQVYVNALGVPLWVQWAVGMALLFCFFGALIKTTMEYPKL